MSGTTSQICSATKRSCSKPSSRKKTGAPAGPRTVRSTTPQVLRTLHRGKASRCGPWRFYNLLFQVRFEREVITPSQNRWADSVAGSRNRSVCSPVGYVGHFLPCHHRTLTRTLSVSVSVCHKAVFVFAINEGKPKLVIPLREDGTSLGRGGPFEVRMLLYEELNRTGGELLTVEHQTQEVSREPLPLRRILSCSRGELDNLLSKLYGFWAETSEPASS